MSKNKFDSDELTNKIIKGLDKAYEKLIKHKKLIDGYIVVSRDGKIEKIRARDL